MKKRLLSLLLAAALACAGAPAAFAGYENFTATATYTDGQFTDVAGTAWYAANVRAAYELGLVNGKSETRFDPDGNLTIAEAVKLAAVLHAVYTEGETTFAASSPWYQTYVDYARENDMLSLNYANYNVAATRAQFATILAAALPDEALTAINDVEDGAIPDVSSGSIYAADVYQLYRAGVLTGSDDTGSFRPSTNIRRREVAAVVTRMADPSLRLRVSLLAPTELTSQQVFAQCSPAVFYIEVYDRNGNATASGSGVLLSATGEAMTNYHVIAGAASARAKTTDGVWHDVTGVYDYDETRDLARLQIAGSGFSYLTVNETVSTGAAVYAIGSPLGLENTISNGIVSAASRTVNGQEYIQTTAAISHGSSGGALLDTSGRLVGITSAYIDGGQSLNLAIPTAAFAALSRTSTKTLSELFQTTTTGAAYYEGYYPMPDFGAFAGAPLSERLPAGSADDMEMYVYRLRDIPGASPTATVNSYLDELERCGFAFIAREIIIGLDLMTYYLESQDMVAVVGMGDWDGQDSLIVGMYYGA